MVGNFLVYCNPYGQPPHYEQSHFRTPTSLRTILPNHLTSELNIIRSNMVINRTCATLQKTHNLHNHPPLKIYLTTSKIKIYTKRTKPIKIFQYPPLPQLMRHSKVKNNKKLWQAENNNLEPKEKVIRLRKTQMRKTWGKGKPPNKHLHTPRIRPLQEPPPYTSSTNKPKAYFLRHFQKTSWTTIAKPVNLPSREQCSTIVTTSQGEIYSLRTSKKKCGEDTTNNITSLKTVRLRPFEFPKIR